MSKSNTFFVYGLLGGIIGTGVTLAIGGLQILPWQSASIFPSDPPISSVTTTASPQTTAIPPDAWQPIIVEANQSSVAVQVFQGERLIRSGSGIIISSDGLVLTSYDTTPTGHNIYQVLYGDKIMRAEVMARNYKDNLALLKVEGSEFNIVQLKENANYESGRDVIITGILMELSSPTQFVQKSMVQYHGANGISLDAPTNLFFNGAQVVDSEGESIGVVSVRGGKVLLIPTARINEFVGGYLSSQE